MFVVCKNVVEEVLSSLLLRLCHHCHIPRSRETNKIKTKEKTSCDKEINQAEAEIRQLRLKKNNKENNVHVPCYHPLKEA